MKKINSNSLTSRVSKSSAVRHSVFKRLLKPAIPLVALLSSQTLLASATCEYTVVDDWNNGFRANISIINDTPNDINDWEVSWAWTDGSTLKNGWSATYDCNGSSCSVTGPVWAQDIAANQTFSFGFIGQKETSNVPAEASITVNGSSCIAGATPVVPVTPVNNQPLPEEPPVNSPAEQPLVVWTLDGAQSNLQYVSTRRDHDGEVNTFTPGTDGVSSLDGSIDRSGEAVLTIDLNDVETGVDTRNGRILNFVFETELLPTAYITVGLDADALSVMPVGSSEVQTITGNLTLHAITQEVEAQVIVAKTSATTLVVSTIQPILIDSQDFEFASGIEVLRNLASLPSIAETVPVYFRLYYVANTDTNELPLTLASKPSEPTNLTGDYNVSSTSVALNWQDNSNNETAFIVRRRDESSPWSTVANVLQNISSHSDLLANLTGEFDYKVIAINGGIPSDSSNIERVIVADVDTPQAPEVPDTPEVPEVPEQPETPVVPVTPIEVPDVPELPEEPETPVEPPVVVVPVEPIGDVSIGSDIYTQQCVICHGPTGEGIGPFPPINEPTLGDVEITSAYIAEFMPLGNAGACDEECADNVTAYIAATFYEDDDAEPQPEPELTSACTVGDDEIHYGARQLKVLTRSEYQNSVEDLIGIDFNASEGLSEDQQVGLFANNTHASIVASAYSNYLLVAEEIAEWSSERNFAPALSCNTVDDNCANSFMNDLAPRIFRRPLDQEEIGIYSEMTDGSLTNGNIQEGIALAMETMLSSPQFLYRHELGEANPNNPELDSDGFELTSYEMATFLAYTFTGSTPDQILMQAAANDSLRTDAGILSQATRLAEAAEAQNVMGDFVGSWLGTNDLDVAAKDESVWPGFDELVPHMQNEIRANFANAMLDSNESFGSIYNADFSYINETLARHYGIAGVTGDELRRVSTTDRGGVLASGAFMARWAEAVESSPILRGVRVRRRMLCQDGPDGLADPPAGTFASREERLSSLSEILQAPTTTKRHETELLTEGQPCSFCHLEYINPLGFGMEDFNTVGNIRLNDLNGNSIDSSGQLFAPNEYANTSEVESFSGGRGLGRLMASLPTAQSCLSEQMFRYVIGVGHEDIDNSNPEGRTLAAQEIEGYACEVEDLTQSLVDESPRAMLERFSTLDAVRYRKAWSRDN